MTAEGEDEDIMTGMSGSELQSSSRCEEYIYVLEHEQYNCTDRMQLDCLPPRDAALAENAAGPSTAPGRERIEPKNTRKPKKEKTWRDLGSEACRTTGAKLLGL